MAQEDIYIAVRSEALSKTGDARYVIKNRETHEVMDDNQFLVFLAEGRFPLSPKKKKNY